MTYKFAEIDGDTCSLGILGVRSAIDCDVAKRPTPAGA
jgi:hypothetical protein